MVPDAVHTAFHLILPTTLGGRNYYSGLTDVQTEAWRGSVIAQICTSGMGWSWDMNPDRMVPKTHSPSPDGLVEHFGFKTKIVFLPLFQLELPHSL